MAALRRALEESRAGGTHAILLTGEPGIGKTRTAEELALEARASETQVLWGRCWEAEGAPAFWVWREALGHLAPPPGTRRNDLSDADVADAARLIPELTLPPGVVASGELGRERGFESVARVLFDAMGGRPFVLVLEDLQGADVPSLLMLERVVERARTHRAPLLVLGTCRDAGLASLFASMTRETFDDVLTLHALDADAIARIAESALGTPIPSALCKRVQRSTNGNPLLVQELLRLWRERGVPVAGDSDGKLPGHLRLVLAERVRSLSPGARRVLSVGAVIGNAFWGETLEATATLAGVTPAGRSVIEDALKEAIGAQLLRAAEGVRPRYRFVHAVIRQFLYDELGEGERALTHAAVANALEAQSDREGHFAELAHHWDRAPGGDSGAHAASYALRAAEQALSSLAYEEAARLCEVGLMSLERASDPTPALRYHLLSTLGTARKSHGATPVARHVFRQAIELARESGAGDLFARAVLDYLWVDNSSYAVAEAKPWLEEALARLPSGDSALLAELEGTLANQSLVTVDVTEKARGAELGCHALAMARRLGEARILARAVRDWYFTAFRPEGAAERLAVTTELVEAGVRDRDSSAVLEGLRLRLPVHVERGDRGAFDRDVESFSDRAQALRQPRWLWQIHLHQSVGALLAGRFAEAEESSNRMAQAAHEAAEPEAMFLHAACLFTLRVLQGRLHEIPDFESAARHLVEQIPWSTAWRAGVANCLAQIGRLDAARADFDELAADAFSRVPRDSHFLIALGSLAQVCCILEDSARAPQLYDLLSPFAASHLTQSTLVPFLGPAERYLGMLALVSGRIEEARRHFENAIAACERLGALPYGILSHYGLAETLLGSGDEQDAVHASSILRRSIAEARRIGLGLDLVRAERLLQGYAEKSSSGDATTAAADGSGTPLRSDGRVVFVLRDCGAYWTVGLEGGTASLATTKGLQYLAHLLARPGESIPAAQLARMSAAGGREAPEDDATLERQRSAVGKRVRAAIRSIAMNWPAVGAHLDASVRTGAVCRYAPTVPHEIEWRF